MKKLLVFICGWTLGLAICFAGTYQFTKVFDLTGTGTGNFTVNSTEQMSYFATAQWHYDATVLAATVKVSVVKAGTNGVFDKTNIVHRFAGTLTENKDHLWEPTWKVFVKQSEVVIIDADPTNASTAWIEFGR